MNNHAVLDYLFTRMKTITKADILELTVSERIQLVEDIWDSIIEIPEAIPLTQTQKEELDRRLKEYNKNPDNVISWDEIKKKIQNHE